MTAVTAAKMAPVDGPSFYGADQAAIHDERFGDLARDAADLALALLGAAGHRQGTVVDLGCGSGILARALGDAGYDVTGVDISPAMVELAARNAPAATVRCGPLLDAELPRCVAVTAIGEALNYATDPRAGLAELERLARRVHDALEPGGVFLFDAAAPGRHGPSRVSERLRRAGFDVEVRAQYASRSRSTPLAGWAVFVAHA